MFYYPPSIEYSPSGGGSLHYIYIYMSLGSSMPRRLIDTEVLEGNWKVLGVRRGEGAQGGERILFMIKEIWSQERFEVWGHRKSRRIK